MDDQQQLPGELKDELQRLGANRKAVLQAVWDSEGRTKAQAAVAPVMADAAAAPSGAAKELAESPAGRKIKAEVEQWGEMLRRSEMPGQARAELLEALREVNVELAELAARWRASAGGDDRHRAPRGDL